MYIALQRTDYKYIVSFHNTDSPWCIARTRFYHLYKRGRVMMFYATLKGMVGKFDSHCRDGSPHFQTHISNSPPPPPPPPCYFLTSPLPRFLPFFPNTKPGPGLRCHTFCFRNARRHKTYDIKISYP